MPLKSLMHLYIVLWISCYHKNLKWPQNEPRFLYSKLLVIIKLFSACLISGCGILFCFGVNFLPYEFVLNQAIYTSIYCRKISRPTFKDKFSCLLLNPKVVLSECSGFRFLHYYNFSPVNIAIIGEWILDVFSPCLHWCKCLHCKYLIKFPCWWI